MEQEWSYLHYTFCFHKHAIAKAASLGTGPASLGTSDLSLGPAPHDLDGEGGSGGRWS
jgi:hypothetical protein